jgi:uroporphyrinogen-III synthase
MTTDFSSLTILVTRPGAAGTALCAMIEARGGKAVHFPVIAFSEAADQDAFRQSIEMIGEQDWVIFNSPQSVVAAVAALRARWPHLPDKVKFAVMGAGTAAALRAAGYIAAVYPENEWSSEGLLAMPVFQPVQGAHIMVVRGEGGRELLEKVFMERGAIVTSCIAYQRILPDTNPAASQELVKSRRLTAVVAGSFESVTNLKILLGAACWPDLQTLPLIVMSERIKKLAAETGFQTIWVTQTASQQAVLDLISQQKDVLCQSHSNK